MRPTLLHLKTELAAALIILAAILPARADYQSTVLSQGPVGYWRLNETTPPLVPPIFATNAGSVGAAGNGTYIAATRGVTPGAIVSEPNEGAVGFNGLVLSNRVRIPYQPQWNQTGPFSVEFWAKPGQSATLECPAASVEFISTPAAQRNGWLFYQGSTGLSDGNGWLFRAYNTNGLASLTSAGVNISIDTNHWYHVVGTYDGTNMNIYVDGALGTNVALNSELRQNTNSLIPLTYGARADGAAGYFTYGGVIDEAAVYDVALSPAQVLAHYQAGTNAAPAKPYSQVILADAPAGYWRFNEPADPSAANAGSLGSAANGSYIYNVLPGQPGPRPPLYPGFESANNDIGLDGVGGGYVNVPPLNLDTNTVTITGWMYASNSEPAGAGILINRSDSADAGGITVDVAGGLNLSYNWNNDPGSINWASGVSLANNDWTYVALVIRPTQAELYAVFATNYTTWTTGTNFINHQPSSFAAPTWFGADFGPTNQFFNGMIDEVAIFNRSLSEGELYTEYSAAIGGVPPQIFNDVSAPPTQPYIGDTFSLAIDVGGTPNLAYQWRKNTTPIAGANSSVLTISNIQTSANGSYDVVVTNLYGKVTSSAAAITVQTPTKPVINQGPSGRTLYPGGLLDLTVDASGGQLHYQWQKAGTNLPGATASAYVVTSVTGADAGSYQVTVTNSLGTAPAGPVTVNVIAPGTNTFEATIVQDGPEAWWRMDEPSGSTTMLDAMGRHDGTYIGPGVTLGAAGVVANGAPDTAVTFDGTNGFADVPYSPALNSSEFTIEAWALLTEDTVQRAVFSTYDTTAHKGIFVKANPDGTYESDVGLNDNFIYYFAPMGNISHGKWAHLASTFSASAGQINYLNGQQISGPFADFVRNTKFDFLIGAVGTNWQGISRWQGTIDEVAVYTHALSPSQIQNHYIQALYGNNTKPVFVTQPQPVIIAQGDAASFSANVQGSVPITFQWLKNGAPILNATNSTLSFGKTAFSDTANYQLIATNPAGTNGSAVVALTVLPPIAFANATNQLVLHLKFDGDYNDATGRGNNGTPVGTPTFVAGQIGKALHYSTTTDNGGSGGTVTNANYVTLGTPKDLQFGATTSFSVAFWVELPAGYTNGDLPFFGSATNSDNNLGFTFSPSYQLGGWEWCLQDFNTNNVDVNGPDNSINDGAWHHFAATFDRDAAVAVTYLDGAQVDSRSIAAVGVFDTTATITIGQDPTGKYPESGSASLDDLAVWHRALSPLEVYEIYYSGSHFGAAVDAYGPVSLAVTTSGNNVTVVWQAGTLWQADTPSGPWTQITAATAPSYTVAAGSGTKFYRAHL